jgi:hypothetical protein
MSKLPKECFYTALSGGFPERVPTLAKIWVDLGAALTGTDLRDVVESLETAMRVVVESALSVKADGARVFHLPSRKTGVKNGEVVEVTDSGQVLGPIDMQGGLATHVHVKDYIKLEDIRQMAFIQFWKTDDPLVKNISDARSIAVPEKFFTSKLGSANSSASCLKRLAEEQL